MPQNRNDEVTSLPHDGQRRTPPLGAPANPGENPGTPGGGPIGGGIAGPPIGPEGGIGPPGIIPVFDRGICGGGIAAEGPRIGFGPSP